MTWVPQGRSPWRLDIPSQACVHGLPTACARRALELIAGAFLPRAPIRHPPEGRPAGKDVLALRSHPVPCVPPVSLLQSLLGAPALRTRPKLFDRFENERLSPADPGRVPIELTSSLQHLMKGSPSGVSTCARAGWMCSKGAGDMSTNKLETQGQAAVRTCGTRPVTGPGRSISKPCSSRASTALGTWRVALRPMASSRNANCLFELPNLQVMDQT